MACVSRGSAARLAFGRRPPRISANLHGGSAWATRRRQSVKKDPSWCTGWSRRALLFPTSWRVCCGCARKARTPVVHQRRVGLHGCGRHTVDSLMPYGLQIWLDPTFPKQINRNTHPLNCPAQLLGNFLIREHCTIDSMRRGTQGVITRTLISDKVLIAIKEHPNLHYPQDA